MSKLNGVSGTAIFVVLAGSVYLYSGIKGVGVSTIIKELLSGQPLGAAAATASGSTASTNSVGGSVTLQSAPVGGGSDTTYGSFFGNVLTQLGIQPTQGAIDALSSVATLEGTNSYNNPINVVQQEPGSVAYNSAGVQEYPNVTEGELGTAQLLAGSRWANVRSALSSGNAESILNAFQAEYATWGSNVNFPDANTTGASKANQLVGA